MATKSSKRNLHSNLGLGRAVRKIWQNACNFESIPLTFGELGEGDKFIALPLPGDENGHDGLRGTFNLFIKIAVIVHPSPPTHTTNAFRVCDGCVNYFKDYFFVIKIR